MPGTDVAIARRFGLRVDAVAFDRGWPAAWAAATGRQLGWDQYLEWLRDRHAWPDETVGHYANTLLARGPLPQRAEVNVRPPAAVETRWLDAVGGRLRVETEWRGGWPNSDLTLFTGGGPWLAGRWLGRIAGMDLMRALRPWLADDPVDPRVGRAVTLLTPYHVHWLARRAGPDLLFFWRFDRPRTREFDTVGPLRLAPADRARWQGVINALVPFA